MAGCCRPIYITSRFDGQVALITGATRGIGLGIAQEVVARGGRVVVTARKADELDAVVAALGPEVAAAARQRR